MGKRGYRRFMGGSDGVSRRAPGRWNPRRALGMGK